MKIVVDYIGAGIASDNRHAQDIMKSLGISYSSYRTQSVADCWIFEGCSNIPKELPSYVRVIQKP